MATGLESHTTTDELVMRFKHERPTKRVGKLVLAGLLLAAVGLFGWNYFGRAGGADSKSSSSAAPHGALTHQVARGRLLITVTDDGNVESAKNIDVKCLVAGGSAILWIVPDGSEVKEGDVLVKLDQSNIEDQLNSQRINYEKAQATKIQAEEDYQSAVIGVQEYAEGIYVKELQLSEANINIAQENLRSSENLLEHTRKMSRKGFATSLQVEADEFAVERAKLELDSAKTARTVLEKFTRVKTLKELEAKREAASAKVRSEQAAFQLEKDRLERLEKQLKNCEIKAPQNGIVIYANDQSGRFSSSSSVKIEEGANVRESQTILRLPDLSNMQVKMTVHESKVERLRIGMPARIVIQDREFQGRITSVANQPEPGAFFAASVKEYATIVKIDGEAEGLKPQMSAEVEVLVADLQDVLTVPVSCVVEQAGKFFCWVTTGPGKYERHPLIVGQTNDRVFEIKDGLKEGDLVLLNPRAILEEARKEEPKSEKEEVDPKKKYGGEALKGDTAKAKSAGASDSKTADGQDANTPNPSNGAAEGTPKRPPTLSVTEFLKNDKDGDGKISKTEAPEQMQRGFDRSDANSDGFLDRSELNEMVKRIRQYQQQQRQPGGGPPTTPGGM